MSGSVIIKVHRWHKIWVELTLLDKWDKCGKKSGHIHSCDQIKVNDFWLMWNICEAESTGCAEIVEVFEWSNFAGWNL